MIAIFFKSLYPSTFIIYYMIEDIYFAEELQQIVPITIPTSFGEIYAQTAGKPGQPLIIIVHGSGPKNSSDQYHFLLHQYLVRVSYLEKFYLVAIDCPGYGRSKGSMIAIKTFPLQLFKEILVHLGYKTYFAMFGHSQGGAAIFNSVYDDPSITQFLLMDRPVCGNIKRFEKFGIPTLLVYDIEDDGHPLWQGKLLYKAMARTQFYTFRTSQEPYWVPDNIWNIMLRFLSKYSSKRRVDQKREFHHKSLDKQRNRSLSSQKTSRKKVVSLDKKWSKKKQEKSKEKEMDERLLEIQEIDKSELYSKIADFEEYEELPLSFNQPKIQLTKQEAKVEEEMFEKKQENIQMKKRKTQPMEEQMEEKKESNVRKQQVFEQKQEKKEEKKEDKCPICYQIPYYPLETNCKHIFCSKCVRQALLVDDRCPMCRTKVTKKTAKNELHEEFLKLFSTEEKEKRKNQLLKFENLLKSIVYVEIGNHSRELVTKQSAFTRTKRKYMWEVFAKEPKNFKFQEVAFNINMGERNSKPVKVNTSPFCFESRGTFSFSCEITIKPRNREYQAMTSVYRIDVNPGTHTKTIAFRKKK